MTPLMTPILSASAIEKRFGAVTALSAGALTVQPGEIHALLGANGCGKSTLMKIVAGTVSRDAGTLDIGGAAATIRNPHDAEALGVALFYQELSLVPQLSIADNIFLGREPRRAGLVDRATMRRDTEALIARFAAVAGPGFNPDQPVGRMTPDQRQLVEILKVLARKPRLIIFDEATAALDRRQVGLFFDMLRALKSEGVASIFISHRLDEVFAIADRITVMRNGATVATYLTGEVTRADVVHAMVGEVTALEGRVPRATAPDPAARLVVEGAGNRRLSDVSFTLHRGEILGLGGLQGQGQSALLQGLFGAEAFTTGRVTLDGRPVSLKTTGEAIRNGIAYVSGDRGRDAALHGRSIFENLGVASMVREGMRLIRPGALKPRFADAAASLKTKYSGLEAPIGSLSGGNQQKIFIARWLATQPSVLLLDDPTKGIDLGAKADFFALVRELADAGASIVLYSSEDAELISLADRIVVFNSGRIVAELTGDRIDAFHLTDAAYGAAA